MCTRKGVLVGREVKTRTRREEGVGRVRGYRSGQGRERERESWWGEKKGKQRKDVREKWTRG